MTPPNDIVALRQALLDTDLSVAVRAAWLCELARLMARAGLAEEGLLHVKNAIELAEANNLVDEKANGLDAASLCHYYRGDHLMVIVCAIDAYQGYSAAQQHAKMGHVLTSVAASFAEVEAMDLAEQLLHDSLAIAKHVGDDFLLARTQNTLGIILGDMRRYDEAEAYFIAAIDNLQRIAREADVAKVMTNRADAHKKNAQQLMLQNNVVLAKQLLMRGIALIEAGVDTATAANHTYQIAYQAATLGEYYYLLGEYSIALTHIELAIARGRVLDHAPLMAEAMYYRGLVCHYNGNFADAIDTLRQGIHLAKDREIKALRPKLHEALAATLMLAGEVAEAEQHTKVAIEWRKHVVARNRTVEHEARAMWRQYFSQHPMIV